MPPAISDDERSDIMSEEDTIGPKKPVPKKPAASKIKSKPAATKVEPIEDAPDTEMADDVKPAAEEDDDDDDNDEEDEDAEDEYVVEKIISHAFNDQNVCLYEVKWLGYESATDRTWEPEENLTGAKDILNAYIDSIGGKPTPKQQKTPAKRGAKRKSIPAQDTANAPASTTKKRARKSSNAVDTPKTVSRPEGTWEDDVQYIDCIEENEEEDGGISAFVVWNDDTKSRYSIKVVRQKCPQKLIAYYESRLYDLIFKPKTIRRRRSTNKA